MIFFWGLITALQVVVGQTLWKLGLEHIGFKASKDFLMSSQILKLFSPLILLGMLVYISATFCFFILLSKFNYAQAQTVVVTSSITFTFLSAVIIFHEHLKPMNLVGIALLIVGVMFITLY